MVQAVLVDLDVERHLTRRQLVGGDLHSGTPCTKRLYSGALRSSRQRFLTIGASGSRQRLFRKRPYLSYRRQWFAPAALKRLLPTDASGSRQRLLNRSLLPIDAMGSCRGP